jgi:predicted nucleic acid-binding protein
LEIDLPDPDDEPFLEVAIAGRVEAIVTGNKRHFPKKDYKGVRILSPAEFLEGLKGKI